MNHMKDLTNLRFNRLTPLAVDCQDKYKRFRWKCKCDCGNYISLPSNAIISGRIKSCGCIDKRILDMPINGKYGKLTIISRIENRPGVWLCKCDCGNLKEYTGSVLRSNKARSCGCNAMKGWNNSSWTGYKDISGRYWENIKRSALKRKFSFEIGITEMWELYEKQNKKCAISGIDINFCRTKDRKWKQSASIDRIDSTKGYTINNVQWVHIDVNLMKMQLSTNELIWLCEKIVENNKNHPFDVIN